MNYRLSCILILPTALALLNACAAEPRSAGINPGDKQSERDIFEEYESLVHAKVPEDFISIFTCTVEDKIHAELYINPDDKDVDGRVFVGPGGAFYVGVAKRWERNPKVLDLYLTESHQPRYDILPEHDAEPHVFQTAAGAERSSLEHYVRPQGAGNNVIPRDGFGFDGAELYGLGDDQRMVLYYDYEAKKRLLTLGPCE